jgi:hypothetical protein
LAWCISFDWCAVRFDSTDLIGITVARKIPFDDPQVLNYVRVGYVSAQILVLTTYYYLSMKVDLLFFA